MKSIATIAFVSTAMAALSLAACGTQEPYDGTDSSSVTDTANEDDYYPLTVGSHWEYEEKTVAGAVSTFTYTVKEKITMEFPHDVGQREVFVVENDLAATSDEGRLQYLEDEGARVTRLSHKVADDTGAFTKQRYYVPGFLRFDREKTNKGDKWSEELTVYTDPLDGSPLSAESRRYEFEVMEEHESVTVPAGTFDCLVVERRDASGGKNEVKQYFFAPGVGKVKEVTENEKEETLKSYEIRSRS